MSKVTDEPRVLPWCQGIGDHESARNGDPAHVRLLSADAVVFEASLVPSLVSCPVAWGLSVHRAHV